MIASPSNITTLKENEIFVFGSNKQGFHIGGAAHFALLNFGAIYGGEEGIQGQSYAIPTVDLSKNTEIPLSEIENHVDDFIDYAMRRLGLVFLVTEIGCGIAGFTPEQIAPMFKKAVGKNNIRLPQRFIDILTH